MREEHKSPSALIRKFDSLSDCELSVADRQWLLENIRELMSAASTVERQAELGMILNQLINVVHLFNGGTMVDCAEKLGQLKKFVERARE